jgi:hypothetical protein
MRLLFMTAWLLVVQVFCVRRFGGSPGKLLLKMRIVTMSGEPLTARHALVRALPDYVLSTVSVLIAAWALSQVGKADIRPLGGNRAERFIRASSVNAFELLRVSSDVLSRAMDQATNQLLDAR